MKSSLFGNAIFLAVALLVSSQAASAGPAPSGQLMFALQTAGPPITIRTRPEAGIYESLEKSLQSRSFDGPRVLARIRDLDSKIEKLNVDVSDHVWKIINPRGKEFDHIFEFFGAPDNEWMLPLVEYAAGNESDEEPMYRVVNRELRDGNPDSEKTVKWVTQLRKALWYLPRFEGMSFRGTRLTSDRIKKYYQPEKDAGDAAFVSSSTSPGVAFRFAKRGVDGEDDPTDSEKIAVVLIIKGKTGRPVSNFAHMHSHEQEILFANGTPMKVVSTSGVFDDSELGKTQVIYLEEK